MSKKIISIFLLLIFAFNLIPAPALTAHAETADTANICYVKQGENGNGTYENPFGSIQEAIESFGNSNGTVYIIGTYDMSYDNFSKWNNEITICGASSDSKISLSKGCAANFKGPTIITNIGFEMGEWSHIGNIGGKLVIDGITMPSNTMIHSGVFFDGILQSSELEIKSGSTEKIYLGGAYINSSSSGIVHDNTLIVNGGAVGFVLLNSDSYQPEHLGLNIGGNVNIIINGGHIYEIAIDSKPVININGSLNIIYNNGMSEVPTSIPKNNIIGGVYKIFSAEGGMVTPSENEGKFILKADENKIAFINGQYFADGIVELNEGTTYVNWVDYTQYRDTVKYNEKYPLASDFPEGLIPLSEDDIINEEKVYPLNTGFDEYNEIPGDSVTNEISLSEKSHSGKFSLKINAADTEMIPLRKTEEFIVGQNNYISTNAISLKRHAIKTNIVKLYINPGENAERISFYLSSANGDNEYSLIKNDKNGDGVFELGKDFSQGKWQEITLDLLEVSPELVNSKANGLYIKANQDSEWLIDDITSDYRVIQHINADITQLANDNLIINDNNEIIFNNHTDENNSQLYDVRPVITGLNADIEGKVTKVNIEAAYIDGEYANSDIKYKDSIKKIILPYYSHSRYNENLPWFYDDYVLYVGDEPNNIYRYNMSDDTVDVIVDGNISSLIASQNGRYLFYSAEDKQYILDIKTGNARNVNVNLLDVDFIDNNGDLYYHSDNVSSGTYYKATNDFCAVSSIKPSSSLYVSNDCQYVVINYDSTVENSSDVINNFEVYKNSETGWYRYKVYTYLNTYTGNIVSIKEDILYTNNKMINLENGNIFNYNKGSLRLIDGDTGIFSFPQYYISHNFETNEETVFRLGNWLDSEYPYSFISSRNIVYIKDLYNNFYVYNTIANESMVKSLLSFDGGNTWLTYLDGYWKSVYSGGTPDEYTLNSYGMTAPEISSVGSDAYNLLYSEGANIYNVGITMLVTSKSDKYTPTIKSIVFDTVHEKEDDCIYSAKFKKYDKADYSRINRLFAFGNGKSSAEGYFLLGIGKEWLYSYKSGELLKLPYIESGILSDLKANWTTLKQYGMTESEINRIPQAALTELFLDKAKPNSEFYVIYVYKTTENSTKDIDFGVKMLSNKKTYIPQTFTLTVNLTDGKKIVCDNSTITYDEVMKFIEWLNGNKNNRTTDFYILNSGVNSYLINYGNITSISFN